MGQNESASSEDGSEQQQQQQPNSTDKNGQGKHSLQRKKRSKHSSGGPDSNNGNHDDGSRRLGGSNSATPSASAADLLAPLPATTSGLPVTTTGDLSHFGNFPQQQNDVDGASSKNVAFLGRYTPFPPPLAVTSGQQKMPLMQPPSSFSAAPVQKASSNNGTADFGVDASTLVVLQDYEAGDSRNAISLRMGDALHLISSDRTGTSYEVCLPDAIHEASSSFFVPQSIVMKVRTLDAFPWYHGRVSRAEAERLLSSGIDGTFLVRESESSPGQLSVSLRSGQRVHHYRLTTDVGLWFLSPEWRFRTVPQLVRHHSRHPDGLACPLLYPAPRLTATLRSQTPPVISSGECWELDRTDLRVMRRLGGGQYGEVYEAIWLSRNAKVAVKTLRLDCAMGEREFLQEARVMAALRHPNLVKLLGVVSRERPFYIVTDFMAHGNLQDFLRARQPRPDGVNLLPILPTLLRFAIDVASAMSYLESRHFIHRDLAARNCLVTEDLDSGELGFATTGSPNRLIVKVGDFGLARLVGGPSGKGAATDAAYTANATGQFPIKWTAPEGLAYQRFSTKSDVWAFGILLWEIVTYGASPYPSVELSGVYALLERGYRMEQPADCPNNVYQVMRDCWRWEPFERPTFAELKERLSSILETGEDSHSSCSSSRKGDRFYEQLSSMPSSTPTAAKPELATSTFGQPYEADRPRSGSLSSPSPSKVVLNSGGAAVNIARCRPHNFSFRPTTTTTSPGKPVAVVPSPPEPPRSGSGDSLTNTNNNNNNCNNNGSAQSFIQRRGSTESSKQVVDGNNSNNFPPPPGALLVNQQGLRGYGTVLPGVPPKPADIANRVTAELAEQMRKRRALAEQSSETEKVIESMTPKNGAAAPVTLHRHSTDPVASKPTNSATTATSNGNSALLPRQQTTTPLVSGDGRPVAPVKPCLRRLQGGQGGGGGGDYTTPTTTSSTNNNNVVTQAQSVNGRQQPQPPPAVLMRGASPTPRFNGNNNATPLNQQQVNVLQPTPPTNVNWTWDDVHRLCQSVMSGLSDEAASSIMTTSTIGRLPTPLSSLFVDLAAALDSLADSLPPRSRFQVRQLIMAIRSATASPITPAQISNILNLIPPPSILTTSSSNNSSTNTSSNSTSESTANNNSNNTRPPTSALPSGLMC